MPAFAELPITSVVHPAYHALPKGGHGSFCPSASRRLSCVLVFATNLWVRKEYPGYRKVEGLRTFGRVCYRWVHRVSSSYIKREILRGRGHKQISTAPAVAPAMMLRRGLGPFFGSACWSSFVAIGDSHHPRRQFVLLTSIFHRASSTALHVIGGTVGSAPPPVACAPPIVGRSSGRRDASFPSEGVCPCP